MKKQCDGCSHIAVCSRQKEYKEIFSKIKDAVETKGDIVSLVRVEINCRHYDKTKETVRFPGRIGG